MNFNHLTVKRLWLDYDEPNNGSWEDDFVFASDYDELLKLYNESQALLADMCNMCTELQNSLWTKDKEGAAERDKKAHFEQFYDD
jgi:hypothetical protein